MRFVVVIFMLAFAWTAHAAPNVVVIVADDLGYADLGLAGTPVQTPGIDSLAADGMTLDRFYTHTWCAPTRASLLTGQAMAFYPDEITLGAGIADEGVTTLPQRLAEAGYATALVGKWHAGSSPESHPNAVGFDHFYGAISGGVGYWIRLSGDGAYDWQRNGVEVVENGYTTDLIAAEAASVIANRDPTRPLFLMASFTAPHLPPEAPVALVQYYRDTTYCWLVNQNRCAYLAQVHQFDVGVQTILSALDAAGIADDTLVLFFSDNGGIEAGGAVNAPLPGQKLGVQEGGIRVRAFARWPGVVEAGSVSDQWIFVSDVYATLERAARLDRSLDRSESRSFFAQLRGREPRRRAAFTVATKPSVHYPSNGEMAVIYDGVKVTHRVIDGKLQAERFDLVSDPFETNDTASGYTLRELRMWPH